MTDYGHPLNFGAVLSPVAAEASDLVALARLADAEGLDLVGVLDHPYRPDFLDCFTLLAFIAGQTQHVSIFSDVACLPLRPPAVLAKVAASLALLTGDRTILGLGAGGMWAEIASFGGPMRSRGQAVQALSEAIEVIRALTRGQDNATPEKISFQGTAYRIDGATAGPVPQARIPLWIGAYQPRMLRLTGEKGDGWIPSDMFLAPAGLPASNQQIDDAALAAGRAPASIQRAYNISGKFGTGPDSGGFLQGPPQQWAEQLTELAIGQGISAFILSPSGDATRQLQIFACEVAPAVAESVAKARAA